MASEVEILVHIAAPSTSRDDALYRTFASAYLDFEPARRTNLPAEETRTYNPAPPPAELFSPQASFGDVWGNIGPSTTGQGSQRVDSQDEDKSQNSWVQPPSEIADSLPDNDVTVDGFTTPTRILSYFLQTGGPSLEPSPEAGRRAPGSHEDDHDITTLFARGTDATIEGGHCVSTAPAEALIPSVPTIYDGGDDFNTFIARGTDAILHEYQSSSPANDLDSSRPTVYEGGADLGTLLAQGTNSILQGDHVSRTPAAATGAAEPCTSDAQHVTPANAATAASHMDESHVSQTPSSPLQSKGPPPAQPAWSSDVSRPRSSDPIRTSQQSQSELSGVIIPATQLPERADSAPPSSKRFKPNPPEERVHGLGRATSDVLPRPSRASPAPRKPLPPKDVSAAVTARPSIDWSGHTRLTSPEPAPSTHQLGSSVPLAMKTLMVKIGDRFQPTFPAGRAALRTYERGYWLLPVGDWPHADRLSAWGFLGNYICRDRFAGWGTRACRDEGWAWVRLYGWEHIAGELYVLLYMASFRRLRALEISWYDGAGQVLIVVGARHEKSPLEWSKIWSV